MYKRLCPTCNKEITYKRIAHLTRAVKENRQCYECAHSRNVDAAKIKQMLDDGGSCRSIAEALGVSSTTIVNRLKKMGLSSNSPKHSLCLVGDNSFQCSRCKDVKSLDSVAKVNGIPMSMCSSCRYAKKAKRLSKDLGAYLRMRVQVLSARAKKQNVAFDLTTADLMERFKAQNGLCFYTGITLSRNLGEGKQPDGLSVDRIRGDLGYVRGNFVLCTNKANTIKNNLTLEELELWLPSWYGLLVREKASLVLETYDHLSQEPSVARPAS